MIVLAILGGLGLVALLMCGGAIFVLGLGARFSGWEETTFHGYTVNVPPGEKLRENTGNMPGVTIHEKVFRRKETGSQYILMVSEPLALQVRDVTIDELIQHSTITVGNQSRIERAGISGVKGAIMDGELKGAEAEYFLHNRKLVITVYAAYSAIKERVGGKRTVRLNESELDKPEEFFESLKFP
jgi:hypothetical protein